MGHGRAGRKLLAGLFSVGICLGTIACTGGPQTTATTRPGLGAPAFRGVPNFAKVSDDLYRGAQPTREGFIALKQMGVRTIVNLREDDDDVHGLGFKYVKLPCSGWSVGARQVIQFLKVIADPANRPVFVHCRQGADRTGCAVAAYRIVEEGWRAEDAIREMRTFGFHGIFRGIPRYLRSIDVAETQQRVLASSGPQLKSFD
jgi:protein tyrosine phosphatase (PTP) superfamily phosphohydrolase (DUF442 family)